MGKRTGARRLLAGLVGVGVTAALAPSAYAMPVLSHPDTTYQANDRVTAVLYVGNTIYIGGKFTQVQAPGTGGAFVPRNHLAAIDATTGAVLPWDPNANGIVYSLALSAGGTELYAGGAFTQIGGKGHLRIAEIDPVTGVAVSTFKPSLDAAVFTVTPTASNLYVGGDFTTVNSAAHPYLAALDPTSGALNTAFAAPAPDAGVLATALSTDGSKLFVGGNFLHLGTSSQNHIGAVSSSTGALLTWKTHVAYPVLGLVATATDVYAAGAGSGGHVPDFDQATGTLKWYAQLDGNVEAVTIVDGILYAGGHFNNYCDGGVYTGGLCQTAVIRHHLLALDPLTGTIQAFSTPINSTLGVYALGNGGTRLGLGGDFTKIAGVAQAHFAQLTE